MNLDISYYVSVFFRRIYLMILVAVGFTAASVYVAMELPPTYRADARLLVESPQIPTNLAVSTVQVETQETLQIIQQRLLTRDNLLQIAREFRVFRNMDSMTPDEIVQDMRQKTSISSSGDSRGRGQAATIMSVAFTSERGQTAADVVNGYVTRILEENRSLRTALAEETMDFFEQEVERLSLELAQRSDRIVGFKRENAEALPTSLEFRQDRQTALQERMNQIQRELALLDDQEERLREVFASGGTLEDGDQSPEAQRLAQLRSDLDRALAVYSESNPRIRMLEAQIRQAEEKVVAAASSDDASSPADPRQAVLNAQIAEIEARRQSLADEKSFMEQEIASLSASIAKTPQISGEIDRLEREYQNTQSQYNQAVDRMATAATGERIELLSKGERISVIENASVPTKPTSPNRPLIAGAGALAGVGIGTALIFLFELLNQSIRRPVDLERHLGVTPIATLPYIRTRREVIWKRLLLIVLMAIVVIGGPAVIYLVHTYFMPIDLILEEVMDRALR